MITLSRNSPAAIVAGAAGFLGSHLTDQLLQKGVQVVGIDDLSSGDKDNLAQASQHKHFHFLIQDIAKVVIDDLPRLDYAFFCVSEDLPQAKLLSGLDNFFRICRDQNPKIVLVSTIDLYGEHEVNHNLREAEKELAQYAKEENANARVVRLGAVYGPRMHFREDDPIIKLVRFAAQNELQKESTALDFSTRAIFISDAVDLLIKAIMHGATAQKIYDGVLLHPVKITEVKQVLLDPIWYENKGFTATQLPPWPTPNLLKTEKELAWSPKTHLVAALKQTVYYFGNHPVGLENRVQGIGYREEEGKKEEGEEKVEPKIEEKPKKSKQVPMAKLGRLTWVGVGVLLVVYALIYPIVGALWGFWDSGQRLNKVEQALAVGKLDQAGATLTGLKQESANIYGAIMPLGIVEKFGFSNTGLKNSLDFFQTVQTISQASLDGVAGLKTLQQGLKMISGEAEGDEKETLNQTYAQFDTASKKLNLVTSGVWPKFFPSRVALVKNQATSLAKIMEAGQGVGAMLPNFVALDGQKTYLVLLIDNTKLLPGGGRVISVGKISFNLGKLKGIEVVNVADLDKILTEKVDPPVELKDDSGVKNWSLAEVAVEADMPSNGKMASWFYRQEKGESVAGVISLDLTGLGKLLPVVGIDQEANDQSFKEFLDRTFYLAPSNFLKLAPALNEQALQKHLLVFMADPKLEAYFDNLGWSGVMPKDGAVLAVSEANMGQNRANLNLTRGVELGVTIDNSGKVSQKLVITYQNGADRYLNRLKIYLPRENKISQVLWGEADLTSKVSTFSDYGLVGYSLLLDLKPNEQKKLMVLFNNAKLLDFKDGQAKYQLKLVKQPGTSDDQFTFKLDYPANLKLVSGAKNTPERQINLSNKFLTDQNLEFIFTRP